MMLDQEEINRLIVASSESIVTEGRSAKETIHHLSYSPEEANLLVNYIAPKKIKKKIKK